MTEGKITTGDGCNIAWRFDGPEGAPVLLLSNSLGTSMAMWEPQLAAFAEHFRVLRYDPRGHGQSDAPAGAYSLDRLGRDVVELLDALGIDTAAFCGLSMGGMVGQWLGIYAPERIEKLILCNTSSYMGPPASWDGRIKLVTAEGMGALTEAVLERWFTPAFRADASEALDSVRSQLLATNPHGYAGCCAAIRDMDLRRTATLVELPTLIIAGREDPATPLDHSEALQKAIRGSQMVAFDAAHLSNVEVPEGFTAVALGFLKA
jgi:3-oxoadipate enol-lactonase